jgi:hypothetical protein
MRRRWIISAIGLAAALSLAGATAALGATPQRIYRDYAAHGRLTQHYSRADLQRAQRDAALQGYPRVGVQGAIEQALGAQAVTPRGGGGGLPFTGLDLALMAAGGAVLLAAGAGLRRVARATK